MYIKGQDWIWFFVVVVIFLHFFKNHAHLKLNGQSRTVFGLLKAPELQRLSVTVEILRVGVMIVGVISVVHHFVDKLS
jgi:hypothetical protein